MKIFARSRRWLLVLLALTISLLAAQCGAAAPTQQPAPEVKATSEQPAAQPATEEAKPTEEIVVAEATANASQQVQESKSVKATELEGGITVVTSELDVSAPRTKHGGTYRDVATSDAVSFHPYTTTDGGSFGYQGLVYTGGLLRLNEKTLDYIPNMAEKYTISEDGLTFTFYLRQDMKWSDGEP
ncbi:MAG: hypothetical protein HYR94_16150, partial [Chloroflexi bacterium]|nr:hypothetical protein [Chloroflexota bacterium]